MLTRAILQPRSWARSFKPLGLAVFVILQCSPAVRAADLDAARELLKSHQAEAAYDQLAPLADEMVDDVEFSFLFGYSALLNRRYQEALVAFDRVLSINPSHAGARFAAAFARTQDCRL